MVVAQRHDSVRFECESYDTHTASCDTTCPSGWPTTSTRWFGIWPGMGSEGGSRVDCARSTKASQHETERMACLTTRELGHEGERLTADYLERIGCRILARNWQTAYGEADIVACDEQGTVLFVEVKTRIASDRVRVTGQAERAVNASKQARYRRMARYYQQRTGCRDIRFDVAAVDVVPGQAVRLHYIRGAFGCDA